MHRLTRFSYLLLFPFLSLGCFGGGDEIETAPLTGEVKTMNGEPVSDVMVVFYPEKGPSTVARTDESGTFTADVALGKCKVAIIAGGTASSEDTSPEALQALEKESAKAKVKPEYASPQSSGLSVTVEPEQTEKVVFVVD